MASAADIMRIVVLVLTGILFATGIIELGTIITDGIHDGIDIGSTLVFLLLAAGGGYATYHSLKMYLYLYAVGLLIMVASNFSFALVATHSTLYNLAQPITGVFLFILVLVQTCLIREFSY